VYANVRVSYVCCRVRGRVPASGGGMPGGEGRAPRQNVEEAEAQSLREWSKARRQQKDIGS
jgi:hypothetical protein